MDLFLSKHFALYTDRCQSKYSYLKFPFMLFMYFLMTMLNMAKFRRDLWKQMCGWVVSVLVESRAKHESGEN